MRALHIANVVSCTLHAVFALPIFDLALCIPIFYLALCPVFALPMLHLVFALPIFHLLALCAVFALLLLLLLLHILFCLSTILALFLHTLLGAFLCFAVFPPIVQCTVYGAWKGVQQNTEQSTACKLNTEH